MFGLKSSSRLKTSKLSQGEYCNNCVHCNITRILRKATTTYKNVETLSRKNDLSYFKSLLVTGL